MFTQTSFQQIASRKIVRIVYKALVLLSVLSLIFFLCQMVATIVPNLVPGKDFLVHMTHEEAVGYLGWSTLLHIVIIKIGVRIRGSSTHDSAFYVHLFFAILYTCLVAALFFLYDELASLHRVMTLMASISFTVVALLGVPMLLRRF